MSSIARYLADQASSDLAAKMVFIAGPRQEGKTTLALDLPGGKEGYLNWDIDQHRSSILAGNLPDTDIWLFDEIHKYRRWREPRLIVECKRSDGDPGRGLKYLTARFPAAEACQIAAEGRKHYKTAAGIHMAPAATFLPRLV